MLVIAGPLPRLVVKLLLVADHRKLSSVVTRRKSVKMNIKKEVKLKESEEKSKGHRVSQSRQHKLCTINGVQLDTVWVG